jgi:rhamnosyltransferase
MAECSDTSHRQTIAGTVVLYRPAGDVIANIRSYLDDLEILYVIDNSETVNREIVVRIQQLDKVVYLHNGENLGIARALNCAAGKAIDAGYELLLTMDQDSCASSGMISAMLECLKDTEFSSIGIITPFHVMEFDDKRPGTEDCERIVSTMTSGNLLNLQVYQQVGPFRDDFFIDLVDVEYCLRLARHGYLVIQANRALLRHGLGDITRIRFMNRQLRSANHSALRRYYMTRNRFHVWRSYGDLAAAQETIAQDKACFRGEIRNILLMERDKLAKLAMMVRGYLDFRKNRFGRYGG